MTKRSMGFDGDSLSLRKAIEIYEELAPQKRVLDDLGRANLNSAIEILMPEQQFIVLSTDPEFAGIHDRLFDLVHEPENPQALMSRLGEYGSNKMAMAMAVQDEEGDWFPTAVVYTYWSDQPELPTHIRPILAEPLQALDDSPKVIVPYTISSNFPGAGDALITNIHGHVYDTLDLDDPVLATLSPLRAGKRGFTTWLEQQGIKPNGNAQKLQDHLYDYLMPLSIPGKGRFQSNDAVQSFHMSDKGAILGAIRPGNDDSPRDLELGQGFMANYVYLADPNALKQSRQRFRDEGIVTVTPDFAEEVPDRHQNRIHVHYGGDDNHFDLDIEHDQDGLIM